MYVPQCRNGELYGAKKRSELFVNASRASVFFFATMRLVQ